MSGSTFPRKISPSDAPLRTVDAAAHVERSMHGKTGSVTFHYEKGSLKRVEFRYFEDADSIPRPNGR